MVVVVVVVVVGVAGVVVVAEHVFDLLPLVFGLGVDGTRQTVVDVDVKGQYIRLWRSFAFKRWNTENRLTFRRALFPRNRGACWTESAVLRRWLHWSWLTRENSVTSVVSVVSVVVM